MKKTVVIHQPDFIPYLGFFHRFLYADLYIALDHVQFVNGSSKAWTHRDKIKTPQGEKWLTISTKKSPRNTSINKIELSTETSWREENLHALDVNYRDAPFYKEILPEIESLYSESCDHLSEFNLKSIELLMYLLDVRVPWVLSSSMQPEGKKNELLVNLLKKIGATHYLSSIGSKAYLDEELLNDVGIEVIWQNFIHPVYPQLFGNFIPNLSSLDMLFNCGIKQSRLLLKGN